MWRAQALSAAVEVDLLLFDLTMLVTTPVGGVFTTREYREWLLEAGFAKVRKLDVPAVSPLILAWK